MFPSWVLQQYVLLQQYVKVAFEPQEQAPATVQTTFRTSASGYEGSGFEIEGSGFEIASIGSAAPRSVLSGWQSSPAHNAIIINEGDWEDTQWEAVGVGIYDGYAAAWSGKKSPSEKSPPC